MLSYCAVELGLLCCSSVQVGPLFVVYLKVLFNTRSTLEYDPFEFATPVKQRSYIG
jgi:hypothetical protein